MTRVKQNITCNSNHCDLAMLANLKSLIALLAVVDSVIALPATQIPLQVDIVKASPNWVSQAFSHLATAQPELWAHIKSLPELRRVRFEGQNGELETHDIPEGFKSWLVYNGIRFEDVTDELDNLLMQERRCLFTASSVS